MRPASKIIEHPMLEPEYRAELGVLLRRELTRGCLDFHKLVRAAEGAYPSDVLSVLDSSKTDPTVGSAVQRLLLDLRNPEKRVAMQHLIEYPHVRDGLPEPHPLDFDWRFTRSTLNFVKQQLNAMPTERIAVLGAPTLFTYLAENGLKAHLFDKNHHLIQHLKKIGHSSVTECDLFAFSSEGSSFQYAVADPPWYFEHYEAFIAAARTLLVPAGKLLLSVLPRLTRPSAISDRFKVLKFAANQGFDLVEVRAAQLHYASPPFEIEALKEDGLAINNWRSGDLFSFVLGSRSTHRRKQVPPLVEDRWHTVKLGKTTVRIKQGSIGRRGSLNYQAASAAGSFRLRSVSRRSPVRSRITVWSSRNIALNVSKTPPLEDALRKLEHGESAEGAWASVVYQYQLNEEESTKLREIMEVLIGDAGLVWNR